MKYASLISQLKRNAIIAREHFLVHFPLTVVGPDDVNVELDVFFTVQKNLHGKTTTISLCTRSLHTDGFVVVILVAGQYGKNCIRSDKR